MEGKWKVNGRENGRKEQIHNECTSELQSVIHTKSMQSAHHLPELTLYCNIHISSSWGSAPGWMTMFIVYGSLLIGMSQISSPLPPQIDINLDPLIDACACLSFIYQILPTASSVSTTPSSD